MWCDGKVLGCSRRTSPMKTWLLLHVSHILCSWGLSAPLPLVQSTHPPNRSHPYSRQGTFSNPSEQPYSCNFRWALKILFLLLPFCHSLTFPFLSPLYHFALFPLISIPQHVQLKRAVPSNPSHATWFLPCFSARPEHLHYQMLSLYQIPHVYLIWLEWVE